MIELSKNEISDDWYLLQRKYPDIIKYSTDWLMFSLDNYSPTTTNLLLNTNPMICIGQFFVAQYNMASRMEPHKKWISGLIIGKNTDTVQIVNFNYLLDKDKISLIRSNSIDNIKTLDSNWNRPIPYPYPVDAQTIINWCVSNAYPQALSLLTTNKIEKIKLVTPKGLAFMGLSNTNWLLNAGYQDIEYTDQVILNMRALQTKKSYQELMEYAIKKLTTTVDDLSSPNGNIIDIVFLKEQLAELQRRLSLVNKQI